jgi:cell division protein FtsA
LQGSIKSLRGISVRDSLDSEISRHIRRLTDDEAGRIPAIKSFVLPQNSLWIAGSIKDPVGMCGIRLEANFHIITGQISGAEHQEVWKIRTSHD